MKKARIIKIIGFIILDLILIGSFLLIRQLTSVNLLKSEMVELSALDITSDRYNLKLVSFGGARKVERAIKDYLDDYALQIQNISNMVSSDKFNSILSYSNLESDGPNFENSIKYIDDILSSYNDKVEYLLGRLNEDTIKNHINSYTKNPYYRSLYIDLMLNKKMFDDLFQTKELLLNTKSYVNDFCNNSKNILIFLRDHPDSWFLEDGEVKFKNHDDYNTYIELLNKVKDNEQ